VYLSVYPKKIGTGDDKPGPRPPADLALLGTLRRLKRPGGGLWVGYGSWNPTLRWELRWAIQLIGDNWIQWDAMANWILREYDEDIQCDVV
jgi:hypothetical protein